MNFTLGQNWILFFFWDIVEPLKTDSFTKQFVNNGKVRIQESKIPNVDFIGLDKSFVFKQLEVEKIIVDQVPPLPDNIPNLLPLNVPKVVVYLVEDTVRYTQTYILSDLATYLLGEQEAEIHDDNLGSGRSFFFPGRKVNRMLLLNQSNLRLVIAYEVAQSGNDAGRHQIIAKSEPFNPYDLELNNNTIRVENGSAGLDDFSFELKCKWVTN